MAMPIRAGAFAKDLLVALLAPVVAPVAMRCRELEAPGCIQHHTHLSRIVVNLESHSNIRPRVPGGCLTRRRRAHACRSALEYTSGARACATPASYTRYVSK